MIFKDIQIVNFRCFESLQIPFDRYLNVFVGGNGSGKTSLLDAMTALLAPVMTRLPFEKRPRLPGILPQDIRLVNEDRSAAFAFLSATATNGDTGTIGWDRIKFRDSSKETKVQSPQRRKETKGLYNHLDLVIDAHNQERPYKLPVFAYYSTNRAVDVPHNRMQPRALPKTFRRLQGLENALESKTDFRRAVSWFEQLESRELRESRDKEPPEAARSIQAIRQAIQQMIPQVTNPRIDGKTGRFAVNAVDPLGTSIRLHLDQLSDGYQAMLGVVMDFSLRLALANPPQTPTEDVLASDAIMIIDEVDLHLHPSWQQRVIPDLRRTFPNTQLILTTHSPQVITTVKRESIRILAEDVAGVWSANMPDEETRGVESSTALNDVMGVNQIPPVPEAGWRDDYTALIENGIHETAAGMDLRGKLVGHFGEQHPIILDFDRLIRFQAFKRRKTLSSE